MVQYSFECIVVSLDCELLTFEVCHDELEGPNNGQAISLCGVVLFLGVDERA